MNAALFLLLFRGGVFGEFDYDVDECTVLTSYNRGELLSADRGDLITSPDRGDLFDRECE